MTENYFSLTEKIILSVGIFTALGAFVHEVRRRGWIISKGIGSLPFDKIHLRLLRVFREVILHERVIRDRFWPGLMHALVFWGFMVFGLVTINHFAIGFNHPILSPEANHVYSLIVIPFSLLVLMGISYLAWRRFMVQPKALGKPSPTSALVSFFIMLLMVTYLLGELHLLDKIHLSNSVWKINWWIHSFLILGFLFLIPRSKHLHLVLGPFNIFFKGFTQPNHEPVKIDMEATEKELDDMLSNLSKMTKKQVMDVFSCVECGRCMDVCPANRGGGILDPKHHFMLDFRDSLLKNEQIDLLSQINVEAGWECTTCQACTEVCPVGNDVEKSDEIRRLQVLVEGQVPQEYQALFTNLQNTGNTEGATQSSLTDRLPKYEASMEYVLWLGCFAKYELDPDFTKSVENFIQILDVANVTYGVLENEHCSGDPANRLGDKLTYAMLREHNLELLKEVKKVVTMCPHCVVNLKQEYSKYKEIKYTVHHHSQVIGDLIENGKIHMQMNDNGKVTYHDPCNLSRMLDVVEAPRMAIQSATDEFIELPESGKNTLCCGAGGGLWWKKETTGRTHLVRAEQVVESEADTVVTGCNFCYGMMNQGLNPLTPEDRDPIKVKDIADFVADNLSA
ncbi:MAG: (Fe-S)-binding protein [Candidatus Neomarinimicrobiota bacterium]|nr:(Fe-S)-binding protein [Candidatus Neomarinimicrobiota bacterium]